jgi:hypothetical protein
VPTSILAKTRANSNLENIEKRLFRVGIIVSIVVAMFWCK